MAAPPADLAPPGFLRSVGEPNRWRVLVELSRSDRQVSELVGLLEVPQNLVSYHLRELRALGLVAARPSAADGRDTFYRLVPERWAELVGGAVAALAPGLALAPAPVVVLRGGRRRPRVLFVCTGNSARSQMAEGLLRHRTGGRVDVRSAGSHPKAVHPDAVRVLAERGIDIAGHQAKPLARLARLRFDRVITLCDKVREICPELPGRPVTAHWSVADPSLEGGGDRRVALAAFRRTADELDARITHLIATLATSPDPADPVNPNEEVPSHAR